MSENAIIFELKEPYIELCQLLKMTGLCESGGRAKFVISQSSVKVNGAVETRKTFKVRKDHVVEFEGQRILIK